MKKEDLKTEFFKTNPTLITTEDIWNFFDPYLKLKSAKPKIEIDEEKVIQFNEIFPKIKGGSGKSLRCNLRELSKSFEWFFKNYDYRWDVLLDAANKYIIEQEKENYKFCRTSKYFIVKWRTPSQPESLLAEYAVQILEGDYFSGDSPETHFSPKVY